MTKNFGANNFIENSDYKKLLQLFHDAVPAPYRTDNYEDTIWRRTMLEELFKDNPYQIITEEDALGLCPEFRMHIRWLPGARITKTEVDFDAVFSDKTVKEWDYLFKNPPLTEIVDPKIKEFITNYMMEYDSIDYINFGEIMETVSRRVKMEGRRTVYIVAIKIPQKTEEIVKIIRLQKFGHIEYVKEDKAHPAMESNHYGQWVKDRYVACERLGMKVMSLRMNHIAEVYNGGIVYTAYSERKYIRGSATDKIMPYKYSNSSYTKEFARLLGEAAALNIVIGRVVKNNDKVKVLFDDGDEILTENEYGLPKDIHVSSITGSLYDYDIEHQLLPDLMNYVEEYAGPVIRRKELVKDIEEFRDEYLNAFSERFKALQKQYKKQKSAFDKLFKDRIYDSGGSIACRWERLLIRVEKTNVDELVERIRTCIDNNI